MKNLSQNTINQIHTYYQSGMSQARIARKMKTADGYKWNQSMVSLVLRTFKPSATDVASPTTAVEAKSTVSATYADNFLQLKEIYKSNMSASTKAALIQAFLQ